MGKDFDVLASYGHVRDLIPKPAQLIQTMSLAMRYETIARNSKHGRHRQGSSSGRQHSAGARPDREGEAIAWHISRAVERKARIEKQEMQRCILREIASVYSS
ncbi:MAG: hypothetical protein IPH22_10700 [Nitrosomonas sp.]|nr:hypothetical protein [Nitrosomonas sp.]